MNITDFIAGLDEATHRDLARAIGAGLQDVRLASVCLSGPRDEHTQDMAQFLAYLVRSIEHLEHARGIIARELEA